MDSKPLNGKVSNLRDYQDPFYPLESQDKCYQEESQHQPQCFAGLKLSWNEKSVSAEDYIPTCAEVKKEEVKVNKDSTLFCSQTLGSYDFIFFYV